MRLLPVAVVAICGFVPPKHQQNEKTVTADIPQTEEKVCKNSPFFLAISRKSSRDSLWRFPTVRRESGVNRGDNVCHNASRLCS